MGREGDAENVLCPVLNTNDHDHRLDQLEQQRDATTYALWANFDREGVDLVAQRRRQRDEITDRAGGKRTRSGRLADGTKMKNWQARNLLRMTTASTGSLARPRSLRMRWMNLMDSVELEAEKILSEGQASRSSVGHCASCGIADIFITQELNRLTPSYTSKCTCHSRPRLTGGNHEARRSWIRLSQVSHWSQARLWSEDIWVTMSRLLMTKRAWRPEEQRWRNNHINT